MGQYSPYAIAQNETPKWMPGEELAAATFVGISIFIVFDVNIAILRVFRKSQGLYYWSMKLGTIACLVDAVGVILKYLTPNPYHLWGLYTTLLLVGWSIYCPAQLLVLYSRLHLINDSRRTQRWMLIMVLSTLLFLVVPTWVVVWPAYNPDPRISSLWSPRDAIVERYNQIGFTLVELVLSGVYVWSLLGLLNLKSSVRQRRVMLDLIYVNVIIVSLDLVVVILLYLNRTGISHPFQNFSYAVKLKLEFIVLNQLMAVAARGIRRTNFEERRYNHGSAADAFSAECREFDRKAPDPHSQEPQGLDQKDQALSHSDSMQITVPAPTLPKHDWSFAHKRDKNEAFSSKSQAETRIRSGTDDRGHVMNEEKPQERGLGGKQDLEPDSFLDVDDNKADTIRHKPSEAFSGDTLRSFEPRERERSPHLYPQRVPSATGQVLQPVRKPLSNHDSQASGNRRKSPHIAWFRRRIPKNGRDTQDEEEEEEIGVHVWENRKGSLVMEVPWFNPQPES